MAVVTITYIEEPTAALIDRFGSETHYVPIKNGVAEFNEIAGTFVFMITRRYGSELQTPLAQAVTVMHGDSLRVTVPVTCEP